jgi:hypothetical protein
MVKLYGLQTMTCVHDIFERLRDLAECACRHGSHDPQGPVSCQNCSGIRRCLYCGMEIGVELQDVTDSGCTLLVRSWRDLGSGRSPALQTWVSQRNWPVRESYEDRKERSYTHGSIRCAFEESSPAQSSQDRASKKAPLPLQDVTKHSTE